MYLAYIIDIIPHSMHGFQNYHINVNKLSVLHTWYLGTADSKSGVRFSKFRPENGNNNNE